MAKKQQIVVPRKPKGPTPPGKKAALLRNRARRLAKKTKPTPAQTARLKQLLAAAVITV